MAMWVPAIMPTSKLKVVADAVGGDVDIHTNMALSLHDYQYNGPGSRGRIKSIPKR